MKHQLNFLKASQWNRRSKVTLSWTQEGGPASSGHHAASVVTPLGMGA